MDDVVNEHKEQEERHELLWWAASRGLLPDAQELVSQGADPACKDKQGRTPAHYAAAHGHTAILEYLATRGVDLDSEDKLGRGPLHCAALGDHAEVVELLCARGVWVDSPDGADDSPLHLAARGLPPGPDAAAASAPAVAPLGSAGVPAAKGVRRNAAAVRALLKAGAKVEVRNARGLTPLGEAVVGNNAGAVALLLDAHAMATVSIKGYSLLHVAAGLGHVECLERLIVEGRRPPTDCTDNPEGLTALHAAVQQGQVACAKLLLDRGADATVADAAGHLPYELLPTASASASGQDKALEALRQRLQKAAAGKVRAAPVSSRDSAAPAAGPAGGGKGQVAAGDQAGKAAVKAAASSPEEPLLSAREQFRLLDRREQLRKVMAYASMADGELRLLSFPPPHALNALQALRKAHGMHTCWEAVAAIRQDAAFQEDASDPHMKEAVEDLRRPNVDPNKYAKDRQLQSVFGKMNKLRGIMQQYGQGFKVSLDDLIAKPTGPSSVPETLRQLESLSNRLKAAQDAAIAACALDPTAGPPVPTASSSTAPAPAPGSEGRLAGKLQTRGGQAGAVAGGAGGEETEMEASSLVGAPLEAVQEGREGPRAWREWLWESLWAVGWHLLRALFSLCLMLSAMWIMGMLPDQIREREGTLQASLQQRLQDQVMASVDGGVLRDGGSAAVSGLEGLMDSGADGPPAAGVVPT